MPWPVRYQYGDESGVLCYYIAEYLLPAAIGKNGTHSVLIKHYDVALGIPTVRSDSSGGCSMIDYSDHIWVLIAFEIAWMLWILLLIKKELHNGILWVASISLFLFPFFTMGEWNDFCMRASIPALLCLCFLVTKNLVQCISVEKYKDGFFAGVLVGALLLGGIGNYHELYAGYTGADHSQRNYCVMGNGSSIEWFLSRDVLKYQYIDWSDSDLNTIILR